MFTVPLPARSPQLFICGIVFQDQDKDPASLPAVQPYQTLAVGLCQSCRKSIAFFAKTEDAIYHCLLLGLC